MKENKLYLSKAQTNAAVEFWLNSCVLKRPVTVVDVSEAKSDHSFAVRLGELGTEGDSNEHPDDPVGNG